MPVATHGHWRRDAPRQSRQRPFGLGFLPVADHGVDEYDAKYYAGIDYFPQGAGDHAGGNQDEYERFRQLGGKASPGGHTGNFGQAVRAVFGQSDGCFVFIQPGGAVDGQSSGGRFGRIGMPGYARRVVSKRNGRVRKGHRLATSRVRPLKFRKCPCRQTASAAAE